MGPNDLLLCRRRLTTSQVDPSPVIERILCLNEAIRQEAFAGLPSATRDVLIDVLSHIKRNLALKEEVACDRSSDAPAAVASASGN
jgi:hypothetical protein